MRVFAISDLHLPFGNDKPMDVFGGWDNYTQRLYENWQNVVTDDDTVVIPGDISWTLKLENALADFQFIHSLNGKKIISKGNHDYWWSTVTKINEFLETNGFFDISILHNNAYKVSNMVICGTRGWVYDGTGESDDKVVRREAARLESSLKSGLQLGNNIKVFLHYPFVYGDYVCEDIYAVLREYGIRDIYYGHIHGSGRTKIVPEYKGIKLHNISADLVGFVPQIVY